jgi:two-component system phosphate regulon response regulator PhoB
MLQTRVLAIEDEPDILTVLEYNLVREGFTVVTASNGEDGVRAAGRERPDIVLLDLLLPGLDGIEVFRQLKQDAATRDIPIIMLTAKGEESDIVLGLGMGADDYVTKPFSPKELMARIRAVLRRGMPRSVGDSSQRLDFEGLSIDPVRHEVRLDGRPVAFTATEFRLLHTLASSPGRVFTRDQLVARVIGHGTVVIDRNIDVHIRAIRNKLSTHRDVIETVRGVGYRFHDPTLEQDD